MNRLLLFWIVQGLALNPVLSDTVETKDVPSLAACLSRDTHVTLTFSRPHWCTEGEVLVLEHNGREILQWTAPCTVDVSKSYRGRVRTSCPPTGCQLQLQLQNVTEEDQGLVLCRQTAAVGPRLDRCGVRLLVSDVPDLKRSCSYSSSDRTLRCDDVIPDVLVFRKGEHSDRVVRYLTAPFQFQLGGGERGVYVATKEDKTEGDAFCTNDLSFQVEKHTTKAKEDSSLQMIMGLTIPLAVFLVLPLAGIDIIVQVWREQWRPKKQDRREEIP